jgi:DNA-binding transcriptional LysR family regulator
MTIRHLKVFIAVAEERNMSAAAGKLFLSQPTVSQIISELEKHYGVRLFERFPKQLLITGAGKRLLEYARHIVASADRLDQMMLEEAALPHLRIGASVTVGTCIMGGLARMMEQAYPEIDLFVRVDNTRVIEEQLLQNGLDIALIEGKIKSSEILTRPIIDDAMVLVCGREHPFAERRSVSLAELGKERFVLREEGSGTRELFENRMRAEGYPVKVGWECSNLGSITQAVIQNLGISVLSRRLVSEELANGKLCAVMVEGCSWRREFRLAYHKQKQLTEEMQTFMGFAEQYRDGDDAPNTCNRKGDV